MGTPTENGYVRVKVERAVAVLTVDRPPANALDRQLVDQLSRAATSLVRRGDVGAVVITSTRSRFIAGADIKMLRGLDDSLFPRFVSAIQRGFDDLQRLPMPRIAAVNGPAVGGGLELALACDPRFVAEGTRLGLPEVRLRLLPGAGGTQRLVEAVGKGPTLELLYTGRAVTPEEGLRLGLVDQMVPAEHAIGWQTWAELDAALSEVSEDSTIRALVLTGAAGCFSAGGDVKPPRPEAKASAPHPPGCLSGTAPSPGWRACRCPRSPRWRASRSASPGAWCAAVTSSSPPKTPSPRPRSPNAGWRPTAGWPGFSPAVWAQPARLNY
ncbi:enoyl-CoA hydratase/isomerase family protein [Amycolatopsis tucumanensis]|uniref:Enoyl-CoA hydratase n=1 Tax=Amycolatopsis tucumanensis TaxID=401106 RepID=A0ABP7JU37_9PSEU|nr:enoyl-CoA hydratase/isomerase family protein [Amycolatopsis tucumanensis]MCF6428000.1 enoyl-CoA hydratase/isomerase family protein [Amycolatopsis tucumanensis]